MKLLFVDCCISQRGENSRTAALAKAYLEGFRSAHPDAQVETVTPETLLNLRPFDVPALNEREALASVGIDEDLAPTWFPEGFTAEEPAIETSNFNIVIYFSLTDGTDNFINIAIRQYQSAEDLESADYEIKTDSVQQYSNEKQTFYLFSNGNAVAATWANGLLMEQITGNIDEAEIKHIIDSIGGDIN